MKTMYEAILGEELAGMGFRLEEDTDIVCLYFKDRLVGRYNAATVTAITLKCDAAEFAAKIERGGENGGESL